MRYFGDTFYHDIPYTVCVRCPSCQKLILRNSTAEKQYNLKSKFFIILLYDTESVSFSEFVKKNIIMIKAVFHSSLKDMKVEHLTLPVYFFTNKED